MLVLQSYLFNDAGIYPCLGVLVYLTTPGSIPI